MHTQIHNTKFFKNTGLKIPIFIVYINRGLNSKKLIGGINVKNYKKILSCLLSVMIVLSAGVVIPASVPAVSAKTKSAKTLKKPTKLKAKMLTDFEVMNDGSHTPVSLSWKKVKIRLKNNNNKTGKYKKIEPLYEGGEYATLFVLPKQPYKYKVRAVNGKKKSKFSAATSKIGSIYQPIIEAELNENCTAVKVGWTKCGGAIAYKLYKSTDKGKSYKLLKNSASFKKQEGAYYYEDTSVKQGGHYFYYVVAYNSVMKSKKSEAARIIFKDYQFAVQVGDTKDDALGPNLSALGSLLTVESEDESILKAKIDQDATGTYKLYLTGVKAGYTYIKITDTENLGTFDTRYRVKVSDEPVYDFTLKKGESTGLYDLDVYKIVADLYKTISSKITVKLSVTSNDESIVSVKNPSSFNCEIVGESSGEVLVKAKLKVSAEGQSQETEIGRFLVKVE